MQNNYIILLIVLLFSINKSYTVENEIIIKWFGQSCFLIITSEGTQILADPVEFKGYHLPTNIEPDIVTISHNHPDHNRIDKVQGNPVILKGTSSNINKFISIDKRIKDIRIFTVSSYHSPSKHGFNAIFVFEFDGLKIVHLGDLGTTLSEDQIKSIGNVDILMIPVGGQHTISGKDAEMVIKQLNVKSIVLPMHYKTEAFTSLPFSADDFLKRKKNMKKIPSNSFTFELSKKVGLMEYIILDYKFTNAQETE